MKDKPSDYIDKDSGEYRPVENIYESAGLPTLRLAFVWGDKLYLRMSPLYAFFATLFIMNAVCAIMYFVILKDFRLSGDWGFFAFFLFFLILTFLVDIWFLFYHLSPKQIDIDRKKGVLRVYDIRISSFAWGGLPKEKDTFPVKRIPLDKIKAIGVMQSQDNYEICLAMDKSYETDYSISRDKNEDRAYSIAIKLAQFLNVQIIDEGLRRL